MFSGVFTGSLAVERVIHTSSIGVAGSSLLGYSGRVPVLFFRSGHVRHRMSISRIGSRVDWAPPSILDTSGRIGSQRTVPFYFSGALRGPDMPSYWVLLHTRRF